jgi:hypothetical protein
MNPVHPLTQYFHINFNNILSTTPRFPQVSSFLQILTEILNEFRIYPMSACYMPHPSHLSIPLILCVKSANYEVSYYVSKSQDSSVGIATDYRSDDRIIGVQIPAGAGNFSFRHSDQTGSGPTQPQMQWVPGALSPGVKRPGREADHSPPSSTEVKNAWGYTSTPPTC